MLSFVPDLLQCPVCHGPLAWRIDERQGDRILEAEAQCRSCHATYPVREGIGIFLTPDLPRNDYWEASGSALLSYLEEHPDVEKR
ncbi:MAG: Trm112 family protein, partial [Bacillota bacterium]